MGATNGQESPGQTHVPLYSLGSVSKSYVTGQNEELHILQGISLDIERGETVAIVGASGSGKSTLLHIMGTLANPTSGSLLFCGSDMLSMQPTEKALLRNKSMGFVFQSHHLLPEFTTLENVAMQAIIGGMGKKEALDKASDVLKRVGLTDRETFRVGTLSGGERQRAAIARAIVQRPEVLLADEPTGNLDEKNGSKVTDLLLELNSDRAMAMIIVTHNPELAARMGRCFELKSGVLYEHTR